MHELSVTENILNIAIKHANKANATRITNIYLVIGDLSSIVDDSVQFYWDIIAQDTIAVGAKLNFKRLPVELNCRTCQTYFSLTNDRYTCPKCGSQDIEVVSGDQFFIEAIDIEK